MRTSLSMFFLATALLATPAVSFAAVSPPTSQPSAFGLSREIIAMKDGQTVPPDVLKTYSPEVIAESLVLRLHRAHEPLENRVHPVYDYMSSSSIQMKFNLVYIYTILRDGFLNQHQSGTSVGYLNGKLRSQLEDSLIGVHLERPYVGGITTMNSIRPKYAFLTFPRNSDGQQSDTFVRDYGNIVAVFKDEVKKRSTFTAIDSLEGNALRMGAAGAYTFYRRSNQRLSKIKDIGGTDYWEAQIWGPLTVQKDVAYFLVQCPGDDELEKMFFDILKSSKIPLYRCILARDHSHFEKGAPIL